MITRAIRPDTHTLAKLWRGLYELALECGFTFDAEADEWMPPTQKKDGASHCPVKRAESLSAPPAAYIIPQIQSLSNELSTG